MAVSKKCTLQKGRNEVVRNERIFLGRDILFKILVVNLDQIWKKSN